jgi:cellulose synthase/poly-beta-1,6-N-acetylglucosamine synthase-like glycosyltransferase
MDHMLLKYYLMKRIFLFFDEWLFYLFLIYLYNREIYIMLPPVILYGVSCIYTSYLNINKIEEKLVNVHQLIWLTDKSLSEYIFEKFDNIIK